MKFVIVTRCPTQATSSGEPAAIDPPDRLVAEDEGQVRAVGAPVEDVQVGPADPAHRDRQHELAGTGDRLLDIDDLEALGSGSAVSSAARTAQAVALRGEPLDEAPVRGHPLRTAWRAPGQPKRSQLAAIGLPAIALPDRVEVEHALAGREVQLRRDRVGVGVVDVVDRRDDLVVEERDEVAAERDTEVAEVESRSRPRPSAAPHRAPARARCLRANVNG